MSTPTLQEMLKAGVHFGHRESRRHPKMDPYIFGMRNGVHIMDLTATQQKLAEACAAARALIAQGKTILYVGTKPAAEQIVRQQAERVGMPYVSGRWLGGTLTNFAVIGKLIQKYRALVRSRDTGEVAQKYTKHEQAEIGREIVRLEDAVGGISELHRLPDALFVVDVGEEATAVREAQRKGIPMFAICDSNVDPTPIAYPIPGNDDAVASLRLLITAFTDAIAEGITERARTEAQVAVEEPVAVAESPAVVDDVSSLS